MNIQSIYLNRVFQGLSFDMSHDPKHFFNILGDNPPWRGGPEGTPSKILLDYENIGLNHCSCQKSASYLNPIPQPFFFGGGVTPPGVSRVVPPQKFFQIMKI